VGIDVENTIEGDENISLPLGLDVDEALHDGIWAAALKSRGNGQLVLCASSLIHSLHDGEDDLSLLAFFASHGPDAGIVHTREEKALGHNGRVAKALAGSSIAVPLAQDLGLFLGVHAGLQLAAAIELAVSSVIVQSRALDQVVGVGVVDDEVFYFLTILFVVLTLVFVIDFGLDIDEGVPPIALALSAMTLGYPMSASSPLQRSSSDERGLRIGSRTC
jgi:hypothetical protein